MSRFAGWSETISDFCPGNSASFSFGGCWHLLSQIFNRLFDRRKPYHQYSVLSNMPL